MADTLEPLPVKVQEAMDRYMKGVTPDAGDPTYSVLKSHLLVEELLNDFVKSRVKHPDALNDVRFTFPQTLAIAISLQPLIKPDDWRWEAARRLNAIRNRMAHHIEVADLEARVSELIMFIVQAGSCSLPDPKPATSSDAGPKYQRVDMVLISLYANLLGVFEATKDLEKSISEASRNRQPSA